MAYFKVSLAGDLGSGKSTVGAILKDRFYADIVSVGKIQREMAEKLGMNTKEFNIYQEKHPELDKQLDDMLASYENKEGSFIFDSRMAWHFVPSAFSVYLKCGADEKYSSDEDAFEQLKERRASEIQRYKSFYGVDITDMSNYRFVVDTTGKTPEEVADLIVLAWAETIKPL